MNSLLMQKNTLGIDRGSQKLGLAYQQKGTGIIFPIGGIPNGKELIVVLSDLLVRYEITRVVIGQPTNARAQKHVTQLQEQLLKIDPSLTLHLVDESYTSVQADVLLETTQPHPGQDTVAAMQLLEYFFCYTKSQQSSSH